MPGLVIQTFRGIIEKIKTNKKLSLSKNNTTPVIIVVHYQDYWPIGALHITLFTTCLCFYSLYYPPQKKERENKWKTGPRWFLYIWVTKKYHHYVNKRPWKRDWPYILWFYRLKHQSLSQYRIRNKNSSKSESISTCGSPLDERRNTTSSSWLWMIRIRPVKSGGTKFRLVDSRRRIDEKNFDIGFFD